RFVESAALVSAFEQMAWQDREAVEEALGGGIRLGQSELNCIGVDFADNDGFSADYQQVALRRVYFFVEIEVEAEDHIIGVERLTVGEAQALAEMQCVLLAVGRNAPGFREGRLGFLRGAVDVDQVGREAADYVA